MWKYEGAKNHTRPNCSSNSSESISFSPGLTQREECYRPKRKKSVRCEQGSNLRSHCELVNQLIARPLNCIFKTNPLTTRASHPQSDGAGFVLRIYPVTHNARFSLYYDSSHRTRCYHYFTWLDLGNQSQHTACKCAQKGRQRRLSKLARCTTASCRTYLWQAASRPSYCSRLAVNKLRVPESYVKEKMRSNVSVTF